MFQREHIAKQLSVSSPSIEEFPKFPIKINTKRGLLFGCGSYDHDIWYCAVAPYQIGFDIVRRDRLASASLLPILHRSVRNIGHPDAAFLHFAAAEAIAKLLGVGLSRELLSRRYLAVFDEQIHLGTKAQDFPIPLSLSHCTAEDVVAVVARFTA